MPPLKKKKKYLVGHCFGWKAQLTFHIKFERFSESNTQKVEALKFHVFLKNGERCYCGNRFSIFLNHEQENTLFRLC